MKCLCCMTSPVFPSDSFCDLAPSPSKKMRALLDPPYSTSRYRAMRLPLGVDSILGCFLGSALSS